MKNILSIIFLLFSIGCFSQTRTDSIGIPIYDTINKSITIRSTNYFPFCNKIIQISRLCEGQMQSNCCFYEAQISTGEMEPSSGQLGCFDGTSLFWHYLVNKETAQFNWENLIKSTKKQAKLFNLEPVLFYLDKQKINAVRVSYERTSGKMNHVIIATGNVNGQNVVIRFYTNTAIKKNDDVPSAYKQLISIE